MVQYDIMRHRIVKALASDQDMQNNATVFSSSWQMTGNSQHRAVTFISEYAKVTILYSSPHSIKRTRSIQTLPLIPGGNQINQGSTFSKECTIVGDNNQIPAFILNRRDKHVQLT